MVLTLFVKHLKSICEKAVSDAMETLSNGQNPQNYQIQCGIIQGLRIIVNEIEEIADKFETANKTLYEAGGFSVTDVTTPSVAS